MKQTRIEEDLLGQLAVPADSYWGIHTERALHNFKISGRLVRPELIRAMALVKKACCLANMELGYLEKSKGDAIIAACDDIVAGQLADQFPLDALQGGAGTSTNMNVNEVVANRAIELLGGSLGNYTVIHPIEDVNRHQSTNDTYPTALKVAAIYGLRRLSQAVAELQGAFQEKEKAFGHLVKVGRTEMQEAVPITLGAEFSAFAEAISRDRWRTYKCEERLRVVNLGGTAVGTGLCAPRPFIFLVIEKLRGVSGLGLSRGENLMGETANADVFVEVSGILKAHAVNLIKIANDLRLMNLTGEIHLPRLQAGSSIMPGKVNPVLMEAAIQVGVKVLANDLIIADAAGRGSSQINEFLPLLGDALLESLDLLEHINLLLAMHVQGVDADEERCRFYFERSDMIVTALVPYLGYEKATSLIEQYRRRNVPDLAGGHEAVMTMKNFLEKELGNDLVEKVFSPYQLTALGYRDDGCDPEGK
ncbi:MAG: aspartate ammonia-lyase [Syntrophaceae bacterium]|nr:aspartate ammonia-lyase [Syntrophaceae bacterium]